MQLLDLILFLGCHSVFFLYTCERVCVNIRMMLGVNVRVFLLNKAAGTRPWRPLWDVSHPCFLGVLCACSQAGGNSRTSSLGASGQGDVHHIHQEGGRIWGSGLSHTHHAGFEARPSV